MRIKNSILTIAAFWGLSATIISGCAKGEEDPWLSIHSRDTRITQTWSLVGLSGNVVETLGDSSTNYDYEFDGTNLYITTVDSTSSYKYQYDLDIKEDGSVFSQEFVNNFYTGNIVSQSSQNSYWYWGNDDQNKTSINMDLTGIFLYKYKSFDIPRLAYSDMTLHLDFTDNYTTLVTHPDSTFEYVAGSSTVDLELKWEVNVDGL